MKNSWLVCRCWEALAGSVFSVLDTRDSCCRFRSCSSSKYGPVQGNWSPRLESQWGESSTSPFSPRLSDQCHLLSWSIFVRPVPPCQLIHLFQANAAFSADPFVRPVPPCQRIQLCHTSTALSADPTTVCQTSTGTTKSADQTIPL